MLWIFLACFLLTTLFLYNGRRRMQQGRLDDAGLNFVGAAALTVAGIIIVQFI